VATGAITTLLVWLFGDLSGKMVSYGTDIQAMLHPNGSVMSEAFQQFTVLSIALGFISLALTSFSVWTCNFVANRQVRSHTNVFFVSIIFSSVQEYKRFSLNTVRLQYFPQDK
jgi:hypothetical protein